MFPPIVGHKSKHLALTATGSPQRFSRNERLTALTGHIRIPSVPLCCFVACGRMRARRNGSLVMNGVGAVAFPHRLNGGGGPSAIALKRPLLVY